MGHFKKHISAFKGLACLFIMLGHYTAIVKYAQSIDVSSAFIHTLDRFKLYYLINEQFWLDLFFLVSGYLCAHTRITKLHSLAIKCFCRFLRFVIPIWFSCAVVYVLYLIFGFHNAETTAVFSNNWFQSFYPYPLPFFSLIKAPYNVLFNYVYSYNAPFWVLSDMMKASMLIYVCTYVQSRLRFPLLRVLAYAAALYMAYRVSSRIAFYCLVGMGLHMVESLVHRYTPSALAAMAIIATYLLATVYNVPYTSICFFCSLILFVPLLRPLNACFSHRALTGLADLSFGVYAFHWPVMCSVGSLLLLFLQPHTGLSTALLLSCVFSALLTLVMAYFFSITLEKLSSRIIRGIQARLESIAAKAAALLPRARA